ncbi:hypothetical protein [Tissierella creatinophila]|uniref:Uncharacterized protein n=1 Tax=Tissierella creatinophila DSM 6911 TaxID=1123403 RepID=A0A1U7M5T5_TISCR|nr:hypothetical protein [Tissierella creatinophila]OLS02682.1 hypothetical protein TICRE_13270 [Tissierella creatinophila DSM 6911]
MKWNEAVKNYPNKWLLFEAIESYSKEGNRIIKDLSVINSFDDSRKALEQYSEMHKKDKSREMYVYHTKNKELIIEEKRWIGVREYG